MLGWRTKKHTYIQSSQITYPLHSHLNTDVTTMYVSPLFTMLCRNDRNGDLSSKASFWSFVWDQNLLLLKTASTVGMKTFLQSHSAFYVLKQCRDWHFWWPVLNLTDISVPNGTLHNASNGIWNSSLMFTLSVVGKTKPYKLLPKQLLKGNLPIFQ